MRHLLVAQVLLGSFLSRPGQKLAAELLREFPIHLVDRDVAQPGTLVRAAAEHMIARHSKLLFVAVDCDVLGRPPRRASASHGEDAPGGRRFIKRR